MKKILLILMLIFALPSFSSDWDDFENVDRMWDGQKTITDKEFEEVMQKLEENNIKKEEKQQQKKIKKISGGGKSLHKELDAGGEVPVFEKLKSKKEEGILVNTPVNLLIGNTMLEKGYYKVIAERDKETNKIYVNFYQSQFFKAKLEVIETDNDFGQDKLDFAELLPYNESFVKMIFGSLDFNAYAFIPYSE